MVEITDTGRHVAPDSDNEGWTSGSDDEAEQKEVEVTFEAGKAHRRKSSIDVLHVAMPLFHRTTRETECIVHKLLESQQHAEEAVDDPTEDPEKTAHRRPPSSSHYHHDSPHRDSLATVQEAPDDCLESSGTSRRGGGDGMIEQQRDRNVDALGQPDEQAWKREMLQSVIPSSDVDTSDAPSKTARETLESRLLTKKQLSDMAWGVRELSRRLSSIRLKPKVRSLFILTKIYDRDLIPRTREIVRWLLSPERERRLTVYVEDRLKDDTQFNVDGIIGMAAEEYANRNGVEVTTARDKVAKQLRYWDADLCRTKPHSFDFIITLGGDGTVLYGGWLFQNIVPPVISFSLGSLGFMTKFDFSDFDTTLTTAFSQGVTVSLRLRFEGTIMRGVQKPSGEGVGVQGEENAHRRRDLVEELIGEEMGDERTHKPDGTYHVLNEIVVDRGPNPTLSNMELFGDDEHLTSILADGVCVSTPTGSTAYNLAAGGSLCHPENPIMLVTAIAPHTLSFRPILLPDTIVLRVGVPYDSRTSSWASFDGRERVELHPGDYVTISASRYPFATVQVGGRRSEDWVGSICGKLGWNRRQKQKPGFKIPEGK